MVAAELEACLIGMMLCWRILTARLVDRSEPHLRRRGAWRYPEVNPRGVAGLLVPDGAGAAKGSTGQVCSETIVINRF